MLTTGLRVIFSEACMFWEVSILAALHSLLQSQPPVSLLMQCICIILNHNLGRMLRVKTASSPPQSYLSPHSPCGTHAHAHKSTTHTHRANAVALSLVLSAWLHSRIFSWGQQRPQGKNWCCHAHLKIVDPIHMCLNIHMPPLACGKLAFKRNHRGETITVSLGGQGILRLVLSAWPTLFFQQQSNQIRFWQIWHPDI